MNSDLINAHATNLDNPFQIPGFWEKTYENQLPQFNFHIIPPIGPQKLQASLLAVTHKYQLFQTQAQSSTSLLIKRLKPQWKDNQDLRQQALREAQILKSLAQNLPTNSTYQEALALLPQFAAKGFDTDLPFLAYAFIKGYSLRDIYRIQVAKTKTFKTVGIEQSSDIPSTEKLLTSLAQQLACLHLHPHPIVHGYLSNEHVIYDSEKCYIIGLGYALFEHQKIDNPLRPMGSFYLSPEQAQGRLWSKPNDIYQLGILAYENCVKKRWNPGQTHKERVAHAAAAVKIKTEHLTPYTKPSIAALIAQMLDPKPEARPSILEILSVLK